MLPAPQNALLQYVLDAVPQPAVPPPAAVAALGSAGAVSGSRYSTAQALGPHCGDGVCQAGETCATCAYDCKQVPVDRYRLTITLDRLRMLFAPVLGHSKFAPAAYHIHSPLHRPANLGDALASPRAHEHTRGWA